MGWRRRPSGIAVPRVDDGSAANHIPRAEGFERFGLVGERNRECEITVNYEVNDVVVHLASKEVELPLGFSPDEAEEIAERLQAAAAHARERRKRLP